MEEGCVVDNRETTLPLLLSPVSRMSQWSDTEELVDPKRIDREGSITSKLDKAQQFVATKDRKHLFLRKHSAGWTVVNVYIKVESFLIQNYDRYYWVSLVA